MDQTTETPTQNESVADVLLSSPAEEAAPVAPQTGNDNAVVDAMVDMLEDGELDLSQPAEIPKDEDVGVPEPNKPEAEPEPVEAAAVQPVTEIPPAAGGPTLQQLEGQANELQQAMGQLDHLLQTNQISREQHTFAVNNGRQMAQQIMQADNLRQHNEIAQFKQNVADIQQRQVAAMSMMRELEIPVGKETETVNQVINFLKDVKGMTQATIEKLDDPEIQKHFFREFKAHQEKIEAQGKAAFKRRRTAKAKAKAAAAQPEQEHPGRGILGDSELNSIAGLLAGL